MYMGIHEILMFPASSLPVARETDKQDYFMSFLVNVWWMSMFASVSRNQVINKFLLKKAI